MGKRDNGAGTIRTVRGANGTRYYAYAPAKYVEQPDGTTKCVRTALGWREKKSEAKQLLEEYKRHPSTKYRYTLQQIFDEWAPFYYPDIGKDTQNNYNAAWQQIRWARPDLAETEFREISTADIKGIYTFWLSQHEVMYTPPKPGAKPRTKKTGPLGKSSMQKIKALLGLLYNYGMSNNIVDKDLSELVRIPKDAEEGQGRAFTDAEFKILEKNWQKVPGGDSIYALCYLGFRITEFCGLRPADYNPETRCFQAGIKTAAGKGRLVPVHPAVQSIVDGWLASGHAWLYPDENGKRYNKDSYRTRVFQPALAALGLPDDLTPHSCRHTCGTRLSAAGARTEDIQRIMGHADYSETANTYINQDVAALQAAMQLVG